MLKLDLVRLERQGSLRVQGEIPGDDPLWRDSDLAFETPLSVELRAQEVPSGEIVVRGVVRGVLRHECRRCLDPVQTEVEQELTLVYAAQDVLGEEDGEGDVRLIPLGAMDLDLGEAIREELILTVDPYVLCDPGCRGLCPRCGIDRNEETCECVTEEPDPRWDVLRTMKSE